MDPQEFSEGWSDVCHDLCDVINVSGDPLVNGGGGLHVNTASDAAWKRPYVIWLREYVAAHPELDPSYAAGSLACVQEYERRRKAGRDDVESIPEDVEPCPTHSSSN
jgi:hypothetical protein